MKGGDHGQYASGQHKALKRWELCKSDYGARDAVDKFIRALGPNRAHRLMRRATETHQADWSELKRDDPCRTAREIERRSDWTPAQVGDALARAADVDDVHRAVDAIRGDMVESFVESVTPEGGGRGRRRLDEGTERLSDVDVEEGKMSDILGVPEDARIGDAYDGSAEEAARELVDAVGESEAASMINYAANLSGDPFLEDMQDAVDRIGESVERFVEATMPSRTVAEDCLDSDEIQDGRMHDILDVPSNETISDGYDGSAAAAAEELANSVGTKEAYGMCKCAAGSSGDAFLAAMARSLEDEFEGEG